MCSLVGGRLPVERYFSSIVEKLVLLIDCQLISVGIFLEYNRIYFNFMSSLCGMGVRVRVNIFSSKTTRPRDMLFFMSSLCGVGVRVRVRVNNFSSKTTRPRDVLFFLKDTLSIEDEKLFKACKSVCSSVC